MGGKSSKVAAPDYTPLANASTAAAANANDLGWAQIGESKRQYDDLRPLYDAIVKSQIAAQDETQQQGRDYYNYLADTYRPLEKAIVADAETWNSPAYREQLASQAAADAGQAFARTQEAGAREMASMGVNPNSGRFAGQQNASALALAAARAGTMSATRQQARDTAYARRMDAVGLGRNLPGASAGAYQLALSAGNAAGQNARIPGQDYMQGMAQGANTIAQGRSQQIGGLGSILGAQTSIYGADLANSGANAQGLGSLIGLLGAAGIKKWG